MRHYCAAFMPEDDGRYSVFFPDLPGCQTMGDTLDDAFTQAADALALYLESRADLDYPIPEPTDMATAQAKIAAEMEDLGETVPAGTVMQMVPTPDLDKSSMRVSVSFKRYILEMIDRKATALGMTRSGFLSSAAIQAKVDQANQAAQL